MKDIKADVIEKQFLSMIMYESQLVADLIQIKPKYLKNKTNQEIFEVILQSLKKLGVVDYSYVLDNLNSVSIDVFADIVSSDNVPITDIKINFSTAQCIILDNYKTFVINNLTEKLKSKDITCDEYLAKMNKIDNIRIQNVGTLLTMEELNAGLEKGKPIDLGNYKRLDNLIKLIETDLLIVGGKTGTGKTSFLINLMNNLMDKYHCIYLNMEVGKPTLYSRFISTNAHVPLINVLKPNTEYQASLIEDAKKRLIEKHLYVETKPFTLNEIENYIKLMKSESKHTIIFLDHLGLITNDLKKNQSIYEQVTSTVKHLRQLCIKYDVTMIAACQLNRASDAKKKLDSSALRDSGEIEQSACKILMLSLQEGYDDTCLEPIINLQLTKNRDGMTGEIEFVYTKVNQIFKERENYDN